jgi:monofunctional biosynthetic peptidoglycan transglycosylase
MDRGVPSFQAASDPKTEPSQPARTGGGVGDGADAAGQSPTAPAIPRGETAYQEGFTDAGKSGAADRPPVADAVAASQPDLPPVDAARRFETLAVRPEEAAAFDARQTRSAASEDKWQTARGIGLRAAKVVGIVAGAWFCVVLFLILIYRFVNPPFSTLMAVQWVGGTSIEQQWVPLNQMSPHLMRAVIASEDGRFCSHWGIDYGEIAAAIRRSNGGLPRGASTITMQVAKNLFLLPTKSYVRKLIEVPLTYAIELAWPKWRILEVYLNIAEWGPGIFGAEAASQAHFGRSADGLSPRQAAQLAVALPNPFARDPGDPGPWAARRASVIQKRAANSPEEAACILGGN